VDDLFGKKQPVEISPDLIVDQPAVVETPMRKWVDNTGGFTVVGRLIVIGDGHVQLLKENGRTTTVPVRRLSLADRDYVQTMMAKHGQGAIGRVAAR
jgi:hypothetical protein